MAQPSLSMTPEMHKAIMMAMRVVQGKSDSAPVEYYELCKCHEPDYSHPPKGISGRDLIAAAGSGCLICGIVKSALTTALDASIDEAYNVVYKLKAEGSIKIRYMFPSEWKTVQRFQVYLCQSIASLSNEHARRGSNRHWYR